MTVVGVGGGEGEVTKRSKPIRRSNKPTEHNKPEVTDEGRVSESLRA